MTKSERIIFEHDVDRRYTALMEQGDLSPEECSEQAREEAEAAYDDHCDSRMEDAREKEWE